MWHTCTGGEGSLHSLPLNLGRTLNYLNSSNVAERLQAKFGAELESKRLNSGVFPRENRNTSTAVVLLFLALHCDPLHFSSFFIKIFHWTKKKCISSKQPPELSLRWEMSHFGGEPTDPRRKARGQTRLVEIALQSRALLGVPSVSLPSVSGTEGLLAPWAPEGKGTLWLGATQSWNFAFHFPSPLELQVSMKESSHHKY